MRGVREEGRVRAAGVGDEERVERAERLVQQDGFLRQLHWMILAFADWMLCLATDAFLECADGGACSGRNRILLML